jgi:hypothetical protein
MENVIFLQIKKKKSDFPRYSFGFYGGRLGDIGLLTVSEGERKMMEPVKGSHRMILFSYGKW